MGGTTSPTTSPQNLTPSGQPNPIEGSAATSSGTPTLQPSAHPEDSATNPSGVATPQQSVRPQDPATNLSGVATPQSQPQPSVRPQDPVTNHPGVATPQQSAHPQDPTPISSASAANGEPNLSKGSLTTSSGISAPQHSIHPQDLGTSALTPHQQSSGTVSLPCMSCDTVLSSYFSSINNRHLIQIHWIKSQRA